MVTRLARLMCVVVVAAVLAPYPPLQTGVALADGDPASDVLLADNVFYPYSPAVPRSLQIALNTVVARARARGLALKVALIAAPTDLGVIPDLFGKPQAYASFLDQEISFQGPQRLLVVMSTGYGLRGFDRPAQVAAGTLALPAGRTSTDLARAALVAVPRLAAASGRPIPGVAGRPGAGDGSSSRAPLAIGLGAAALLVAGALIVLRIRTAPRSTP